MRVSEDRVREVQVLSEEECLDLLAGAHIGRVAYVRRGRPEVVPVNFAFVDGSVVMRLGPSATLDVLRAGADVAFEVDRVDEAYHTGWSVVVHGRAEELGDAAAVARLPLRPWAPGAKDHGIRIRAGGVSGRRIV